MQTVQLRQHAEYRLAGAPFQPVQSRPQQPGVVPKAIDDEAMHPRLSGRRQQFQLPHQMGEHAAAVDVGNQDYRAVRRLGEAHVGDVVLAQVDLRRAARPLATIRPKPALSRLKEAGTLSSSGGLKRG